MSEVFRFKKFSLHHGRSGMKVGTDSVLLGAYVQAGEASNILDIGCGCGVISIMMAQRFAADIIGIDIESDAVNEAQLNAENSPWKDRLHFKTGTLQSFSMKHEGKFDLIVSNPPYFSRSLQSPYDTVNRCKHDTTLTHQELCEGLARLLREDGRVWLILPTELRESFLHTAMKSQLYEEKCLLIHPVSDRAPNRAILCLQKGIFAQSRVDHLNIRDSSLQYSVAYKDLTSDFYLDF